MAVDRPPVPAVPSVVLALGRTLGDKAAWLEQRFRSEAGTQYPAGLLRVRLCARADDCSPEALRALCDPLLTHPLWLGLQERALAPGGERGPQLNVYLIAAQEDARGLALVAPLYENLRRAYAGRLEPAFCIFLVGQDPGALPPLAGAPGPVPCFVLGPVKQLGYGIGGRHEPFETIRLALNAFLASPAAAEVLGLLEPGAPKGVAAFALGASAIAVARQQMEAWLRDTLTVRLARACLESVGTSAEREGLRQEAHAEVPALFGLQATEEWASQPDELWQKSLGQRIADLFPQWANEVLGAWGLEVRKSRLGHWQVMAGAEGDLYRHLQYVLSDLSPVREDAQAALVRDVVALAQGLRSHLQSRGQAFLERWPALIARTTQGGTRCLARLAATVAAVQAGLSRARDALAGQHLRPLWLRGERDITTLAGILAAQMLPVRCASERARCAFVPPGLVGLRLLPLVLITGSAGADLRPGWQGLAAGLAGGVLLAGVAAGMQYRRLRSESRAGMRELCRLYETAVGGLLLSEAQGVLRQWQEAVAVSAAQLEAVQAELVSLEGEAGKALDELARFPRQNTYLERQLSNPQQCARLADEVSVDALMAEPLDEGAAPSSLAGLLADALRGDLPAPALGAALIEGVGRIVARRSSRMIETRVEELLVARSDRPFSPAETMDALHRRALPLWHGQAPAGPELALVALSREAAMAFRGWLAERGGAVRVLPTLQRDRITYLRCRRILAAEVWHGSSAVPASSHQASGG